MRKFLTIELRRLIMLVAILILGVCAYFYGRRQAVWIYGVLFLVNLIILYCDYQNYRK